VGAGVFARNVLSSWLPNEKRQITIYYNARIDADKVFQLPLQKQLTKKKVAVGNLLFRIFYEQFLLPFKLRAFDMYFSPNPVFIFLAKIISPRTKIIITIHDMIPFHIPDKYGWLRSLYVKFISKYGAKYADAVITVSENSKKDIVAISGVDGDKVTVMYNFIPAIWHPYTEDEKFFLSISTLEPGKNIEGSLQAFEKFIQKFKMEDYKFYWLGKIGWGYSKDELEQLVAQYNLTDKFFFLGYVDQEKKFEMLKNCTALVYLSHYEGFGLPVLEALYFNKPSIVAKSSSLPEVVGNAGILCGTDDVEGIANAFYSMATNRLIYQQYISDQLLKFDKHAQMGKFVSLIS
jgi:glycosyltransferase involved in cell wall biosynthesis